MSPFFIKFGCDRIHGMNQPIANWFSIEVVLKTKNFCHAVRSNFMLEGTFYL